MTPRVAQRLLEIIVNEDFTREAILGDLAEDAVAVEARLGRTAAQRWYWRQVVASAPHLIVRPVLRARAGSWARAGLAAFGGYAAVVVLVIATDMFLGLPGKSMFHTALASLAFTMVAAGGGGYVAAWIGKHAPYASALALGLLFVAIGFLAEGTEQSRVPTWYYVCLQLSAVPSTLCGAALRCRGRRRSAAAAAG